MNPTADKIPLKCINSQLYSTYFILDPIPTSFDMAISQLKLASENQDTRVGGGEEGCSELVSGESFLEIYQLTYFITCISS